MHKKAQVTIFVIIGILILGTIGIMYYVKSLQSEEIIAPVESSFLLLEQPEQFQNYIESCIREEAMPLIKKLGLRGGMLSQSLHRKYHNVSYNYLCVQEPGRGCVNTIITREFMENELKREILKKLPFCIDLTGFREQGFEIQEGKMDLKVVLASDKTNLILDYPIKVSRENFNFERRQFSVIVKSNLGRLYDLAVKIVNSEIENAGFDKDEWMLQNKIEIDRHKPYPDTVYSLKKYQPEFGEYYEFNFAIQGMDTVSKVENPLTRVDFLGYCYTDRDKNCYANSAENECLRNKGEFSKTRPENCEGISGYDSQCNGSNCRDCGSRKHSEAWCEYDSITGNGLDYVGSRHYLRSCFNGRIYYEECRDFREEICVEDNDNAVCRPNRWQDCVLQQAQSSCEDSSERDCVWDDGLLKSYVGIFKNNKCHPIVPPGFRHWQSNGFKVCQMANEYNDCDGAGCPQDWIDSSARYCYSMGDCGSSRNIADQISEEGYQNLQGRPSSFVYLDDGLQGQDYVLNLKRDIQTEKLNLLDPYENPQANAYELMKKISEYAAITTTWDMDDFIEEYIWEGEVDYWSRYAAFCDVWKMPSDSACNLCHADKNKPCSEYRCSSLGSSCMYEEVGGYGRCFDAYKQDKKPPKLELSSLKQGLKAEQDYLAGYDGWKIKPPVHPHSMVNFEIKTDEESQCKLSLLPGFSYDAIVWRTGEFSKEHEFRYRMPDTIQIVDYMKDTLQILSLIQLSKMDELTQLFQKIKHDARQTASEFDADIGPFIQKINDVENRFNNEIKPQIAAYVNTVENGIANLMTELGSRRHVVFIKCRDRAGNENKESYVKFDVKEDSAPPELIEDNNEVKENIAKLRFKINEKAECRYSINADKDYEEMEDKIECKISFDSPQIPSFVSLSSHNYECSKDIPYNPPMKVYVKCKDRPPRLRNYAIHFVEGSSTELVEADHPGLIKINEDFINVTNDYVLLSNNTVIRSVYPRMKMGISFDENMVCRYYTEVKQSFSEYPFLQSMDCDGRYCEKEFEIYNNKSVYIGCINKAFVNRNVNEESFVFEFR